MPPKPIASACWLRYYLILCKKLTFQIKIYSQTRVSCSIFHNFPEEIYMPPKPLYQLTTGLHSHYFRGKQ